MDEREDSIGQRHRSQAEAARNSPQLTPTEDPQQADTTDDDATSVTGGMDTPNMNRPVSGAESMIEADLDNPRTHER